VGFDLVAGAGALSLRERRRGGDAGSESEDMAASEFSHMR
jgi:hypothetical protein